MSEKQLSTASSFLMQGKRARKAWKTANTAHKQLQEEIENRVYRYYLRTGDEGKITFLTGNLDADGVLDVPIIQEHQLHLKGSYKNWFRCTDHGGQGAEPCPICDDGDKPYVAALFTVIDHNEWTDKKGKVHKHEVKLYVVKREGLNILQRYATKRQGLAGTTWEVGRSGDNSPNTGNSFDFLRKNPVDKVMAAFNGKGHKVSLIDYAKALPYYNAADLRKKGFGGSAPVGSEDSDDFGDDIPF